MTTCIITLAGAVIALNLIIYLQPRFLLDAVAKRNPRVPFYVDTREKIVALTVDDGPHAENTPAILDLLREHEARASFFLIGERIPGNEHLLERMRDEGHELGNHLLRDVPSILLPASRFAGELRRNHELLARYGPVRWFRPASGWFSARMLRRAEELGYRCLLASVYPRDGHWPFVWPTTSYILWKVFPGSIIVLHDGKDRHRRTVEVLRRILPALRQRGYRLVTASELLRIRGEGNGKIGEGGPAAGARPCDHARAGDLV